MKVFGSDGRGIFAAPTVVERKLRHPAVLALTTAAREQFFAP